MNIETEHIENHRARFTVEVDDARWNEAKKAAARELSQNYKIPGFRKGKAPYKIIQKYIGEDRIVGEAMEQLGNEVYREALESSDVQPYDMGNFEDFQLEPQPTYVFTVPLQPEIELGDYREVRVEYDPPEVTDDDINQAMRRLQQQEALVEESQNPVEEGDRVTLDIVGEFADGEERTEEDAPVDDGDQAPRKGDTFVHRHDVEVNLDRELEPIMPGFIDELLGADVEDELTFELTIPEDDEDYDAIAGRKIAFTVTVHEIYKVTLPELTDDFAARVTEDENNEEPLTLLELRMRVRENMEREAQQQYKNQYTDEVLEKIVEGAERIAYPEAMVQNRIDDMMDDLDKQLREQNMNLDMYKKVVGVTDEELRENQRDEAITSLKQSLVLGQVLEEEDIEISNDAIESEINEMLGQFGEQADQFRQFFDTPQQRQSIANNLLYQKLMDCLTKIGRGLPLDEDEDEDDEEPVAEVETDDSAEPVADVESEEDETVDETADEATAAEPVAETESAAEDADTDAKSDE